MHRYVVLTCFVLWSSMATASFLAKRDSWGPAVSLGPSKAGIIQTTTTVYPGKAPSNQTGFLFSWLGISNGTGDLIQSVIGSYPKGLSECDGANADTTWCVSSEVYGLDPKTKGPNQWVGSLTTAHVNYTNGVMLNYTLIDKKTYLWKQTMNDAVTGQLLSTFNKTSAQCLDGGQDLSATTTMAKPALEPLLSNGTLTRLSFSRVLIARSSRPWVRLLGRTTLRWKRRTRGRLGRLRRYTFRQCRQRKIEASYCSVY